MIIKTDEDTKFDVKIQIKPMPNNCLECPFYCCMGRDEDFGNDTFDCILNPIEDSFSIAVHRYKNCPLDKE